MKKFEYPLLGETLYKKVLPNGLTVAVVPRPGFTRKLAYFVTDYGAVHTRFNMDGRDYVSPDGVAHYLEHKMFDMPGGRDVTAEFAALGASPNAFTSYDMTAYYFVCTENFRDCLKLLLEFVSTPYFTSETVEKEQGIIGQEIGMNEDSPDTAVFENLMRSMYALHPIREPILGTRETIAQITDQVLYDCHRAFYRPGNMILCVVGDVDPAEVEGTALEVLPKTDEIKVTRAGNWPEEMACAVAETRQTMEVAMPMFQLGFKCEPVGTGREAIRQEIVGDLAAEALFGESSELYLKLYEEGVIDSSFGGGFETIDGMAMLTASGDSDFPERVRDEILAQCRRIVAEGIEETAFQRMKRSALGRRIRDLDSFDSTAFRICAYHFACFDYFDFPEIYREVTAQEVRGFLGRVVTEARCNLSIIEPNPEEDA